MQYAMSPTVHSAATASQYATCSAVRPLACRQPSRISSAAGSPKYSAASKRSDPRSMPGDPAPAQSQSIMPVHEPPDHKVLPCHRSPWTNTVTALGSGRSPRRRSALASNSDVPTDRRHAAKSTSGSERARSGSPARGDSGTACSTAAAAPSARNLPAGATRGILLLPGRTVVTIAIAPAALPLRSAAINRGAARAWS